MSRAPSEATQIRTLRAELKRAHNETLAARNQCAEYRARATRAEQEAAEWKARFDILLRRDQEKQDA